MTGAHTRHTGVSDEPSVAVVGIVGERVSYVRIVLMTIGAGNPILFAIDQQAFLFRNFKATNPIRVVFSSKIVFPFRIIECS